MNWESEQAWTEPRCQVPPPNFCREWVLKSSILIAMAVYTYLRLIVDHHGTAQLQALRQKEVDFCMSLLRERVRMKTVWASETQDGTPM